MKTLMQNLNCRIGKEEASSTNQTQEIVLKKVAGAGIVITAEQNLSTC